MAGECTSQWGRAWQGGMHGQETCVAGGCAWLDGSCMAGGVVHGRGRPAWQERRPLQHCLLLECILVHHIIHIHHIIEYMAELFSSILISH